MASHHVVCHSRSRSRDGVAVLITTHGMTRDAPAMLPSNQPRQSIRKSMGGDDREEAQGHLLSIDGALREKVVRWREDI